MASRSAVNVRRVYEQPGSDDGYRVLVDRVWPRGLRKDDVRIDEWCRQVAPSTQLRQWYGHEPSRYAEFARRYRAELRDSEQAAALDHLRQVANERPVTLLTATKRSDISQATVLAEVLQEHPDQRR